MTRQVVHPDLDEVIDSFEAAHVAGDEADLQAFLPADNHPQFCAIATELVRVDLEHRWRRGCAKPLESYRAFVAPIFADSRTLGDIAFEEFRLRRQKGEDVEPDEYRHRFGVDTDHWPDERVVAGSRSSLANVLGETTEWIDALDSLPTVGGRFAGFELVEELGRGSFGRVILARQGTLASRSVVLKITPKSSIEPDRLARLQHTNIVPIYSIHFDGPLQAICMPFFGRHTLADALYAEGRPGDTTLPDVALLGTQSIGDDKTISKDGSRLEPNSAPPRTTKNQPSSHLSHCDTVVRITRDMAAGLAHAHQCGLVHRDLKPANILLTDDGRPMLLDFNLSDDVVSGGRAGLMVGGTLPYMSTEHLRAVERGGAVGFTDDVYSLGVVLFELLAGERPFPTRRGAFGDVIEQMMDDRRLGCPALRLAASDVSPGLESIVRRCLDPKPARRYQHAGELREDLDAHLGDQPLKHAPDRSAIERTRKWCRRHPRIASVTGVSTVLGALLLLAVALLFAREHRMARLEAEQVYSQFLHAANDAELLLSVPHSDEMAVQEGMRAGQKALDRYDILESRAWREEPNYRLLDTTKQADLDRRVAELFYLLADQKQEPSKDRSPGTDEPAALLDALAYNREAEMCYASAIPRAVLLQRARLLEQSGDKQGADALRADADQVPPRNARDRYLVAREAFHARDWETALIELRRALRDRPLDPSVWFAKANVHVAIRELSEADDCFTVCVGLAPDFYLAYVLRGIQRLELELFEAAVEDFDRVLVLQPERTDALVNRALAHQGIGNLESADSDLTAAIERGIPETRVYFMRAKVRDLLGNHDGADADRQTGLSLEPGDEKSWLARGMARLADNPQAALADFEETCRRYPTSVNALRNIAFVQAERLHDIDGAIATLNRLLEIEPKNVLARAGRGVLLARHERRDEAHADAAAALQQSDDAKTLLQAASIYAQTSKIHTEDAQLAFAFLADVLRKEPQMVRLVSRDTDLAPLRNDPQFEEILGAIRVLEDARVKPGSNPSDE